MTETKTTILDHFKKIEDPRREHGRQHEMSDILVISLLAVIAGANAWTHIEAFGVANEPWLKSFLKLPCGIPSHDTITRVFSLLKPGLFEDCFIAWMNSCCRATGLQPICIDGKTLRGSRYFDDNGEEVRGLHLVSAWASANHMTLGQVVTDQKSNEITAIPVLLRLLDLKGCIVSMDAMGCQTKIASQIIDQEGEYVINVKDNQEHLYEDTQKVFRNAKATEYEGLEYETYTTRNEGRGRLEVRTYTVIYNPKGIRNMNRWKGLQAVIQVIRQRLVDGKHTLEVHYYISSAKMEKEKWADVIRGHWSIENNLHWILDVVFKEDRNRTHDKNAAANFAFIRKIAVSFLQNHKEKIPRRIAKNGMVCQRLFAGWSDNMRDVLLEFLHTHLPDLLQPSSTSPPHSTQQTVLS